MIEILWARNIMKQKNEEDAKKLYKKTPRLLKEKVEKILIDSEMSYIIE